MSGKWLVPLFLVLALVSAHSIYAQTLPGGKEEPRSILGRLDQFGQNLFGGIFGDDRQGGSSSASVREPAPYEAAPGWQGGTRSSVGIPQSQQPSRPQLQPRSAGVSAFREEASTPRAGSILTGPSQTPQGSAGPVTIGQQVPGYRPVARPNADAPGPKDPPRANLDSPPSRTPSAVLSSSPETVGAFNPAQRPLHKRLTVLRDSAFDAASPDAATPRPDPSADTDVPSQPAATEPPKATRDEHLVIAQPDDTGAGQSARAPSGVPTPAVRPQTAEPVPAAGRHRAETAPTPAVQEPGTGSIPGDGVLLTQKGPVLSVETFGPRTIAIGREASYRVNIQNSGEVDADEVIVYIKLPPWADVSGAEASMGATQLPATGSGEGTFIWRVGHLAAGSSERLRLKLIPRQSRPFDLSVRWEYQPRLQQTLIEVQEPQIELQLEGPREVQYGQRETYRLRMNNTGNGPAENVMITLLPVGAGSSQPVSYRLGQIEAGEEKAIEVELTARQAGSIEVRVEVRGEGDVHAELAETILVRRAELELAARGPEVRFVGSEAVYNLRVANPGNAPARNIQLTAIVPGGAQYISGIDGGRPEANGTRVTWIVPQMEAGAEETYQLRASLGVPGTNRLEFRATADDALTATAEVLTRVDAMADLAMEVEDPRSPVPVGSDTVYRLRVRNRGTKAAENVEIVAYFSRGIEPVSAEGGAHRIGPGQVVFSPIASLPPGGEAVFSIRAQAAQPGNHVFRAEVHCKPLDTRLVREETTHFYQDEAVAATAPDTKAVNTADRRAATGEASHPQAPSQQAPSPRR